MEEDREGGGMVRDGKREEIEGMIRREGKREMKKGLRLKRDETDRKKGRSWKEGEWRRESGERRLGLMVTHSRFIINIIVFFLLSNFLKNFSILSTLTAFNF